MSADNFMVVDKCETCKRYIVYMEFASNDNELDPTTVCEVVGEIALVMKFENLGDAIAFAHSEWTEYGVEYSEVVMADLKERLAQVD